MQSDKERELGGIAASENKASLNRTNVVSTERDVVDGGAVVKRSLPFLGSYRSRVPHFLGCRDRTHAKQRSHISKRFTGRILRPFSQDGGLCSVEGFGFVTVGTRKMLTVVLYVAPHVQKSEHIACRCLHMESTCAFVLDPLLRMALPASVIVSGFVPFLA